MSAPSEPCPICEAPLVRGEYRAHTRACLRIEEGLQMIAALDHFLPPPPPATAYQPFPPSHPEVV